MFVRPVSVTVSLIFSPITSSTDRMNAVCSPTTESVRVLKNGSSCAGLLPTVYGPVGPGSMTNGAEGPVDPYLRRHMMDRGPYWPVPSELWVASHQDSWICG